MCQFAPGVSFNKAACCVTVSLRILSVSKEFLKQTKTVFGDCENESKHKLVGSNYGGELALEAPQVSPIPYVSVLDFKKPMFYNGFVLDWDKYTAV